MFVERLWWRIKYEGVCLRTNNDLREARAAIEKYLIFHNRSHSHSSLGYQISDQVYFNALQLVSDAA